MRYFLIFFNLFVSFTLNAGIQIEYEVLYAKDNSLVDKDMILPEKVVLSIENQHAKIEKFYKAKSAGKYVQYFALNDNLYIEQHQLGRDNFAYLMHKLNFNITYLNEEPEYQLLDYPCKRAIANYKDEQIEIFYTEALGYQFFPFGNLDGVALVYKIKDPVFEEVVYNAIEVREVYFEPKFFDLPKIDHDPQEFVREDTELFNQTAPAVKVRNLDNDKLDLNFDQGKIIVLNFWFVGCQPCRKEIPLLNQLKIKYALEENIDFIAIATDRIKYVNAFIESQNFFYDIYGSGTKAASEFGVNSYPTHIIIDPEGKVVYYETGYRPTVAVQLNQQIKRLLEKHFAADEK